MLLTLPVVAPLLAAGLLILLGRRSAADSPALVRWVGWAVSAGVLVVACVLLATTLDGARPVVRLGGWPAGIAITLVADVFSALMLVVTALLVLASLAFAAATDEDERPFFVPLALILSSGVFGALLTADLFNLFVFVEVMLLPSYVLLSAAGGRRPLVAGRLYVTVNLLASTVFLAGVGLLYGTAGTVNLGELAEVAASSTPAALAAAVIMLAMAVKAAVVPVHSWLPSTYSASGPAVTVLFSGLLTKVGVYALIRIYAVVFDGDRQYLWLIMAAALLTMVVGVLGAVGEKAMRPVLTFHMVSQIGYMLLGLALFSSAGLAAAVFFLVQYVLVKAALLMVAGAVEVRYGTGELARLGGLMQREPALAVAFAVSALALVGIPPLSGFVAKLGIATAAVAEDQYLAAAVVVGVSLLTLTSMLKVWNGVFWQAAPADADPAGGAEDDAADRSAVGVRTRSRAALTAPPLLLAGLAVVLGLWAEPLLAAADAAAAGLVDVGAYVRAVMGR
ncbi:monovalent cation/H+ antiporter subunit D family protein [Blastococcus sp. PRF04-17]|uniref:monovalent cation/H+ antiporter subunit D family protein n=1 Tax=Blastococcus sp. PRF04-17 TaxID=2933797 RepID=UPI001FF34BBD|nr:monovalent cation/H+ antiporter subunit D family protein [Blastococcus sp. PRF04-17]UOY03964.1 monovalent cation/H+ antiporter subunit D family protein [Blastococcus sp. PRF04-17]